MKNLIRKVLGILSAFAMLALCVVPAAAAPVEIKSAAEVTQQYFSEKYNLSEPSLTLKKYVTGTNGAVDTTQPIEGVKFKYVKVGNLYQVKVSDTETVMAYGISKAFADALKITESADYVDDSISPSVYYFKNGDDIQNRVITQSADILNSYLTKVNAQEVVTDNNGSVTVTLDSPNPVGLYLVVETDVSGAKVNKTSISITKVQAPFIAAVPTYIEGKDEASSTWDITVEAEIKNSTGTAEVEKKIVVGNDETLKDGSETVDDTDTTYIGDTVYFRLKGTVPSIPEGGESITEYVLRDNISKGLTPVHEVDNDNKLEGVTVVARGDGNVPNFSADDYVISDLADYTKPTDAGLMNEFVNGKTFTVTFTGNGLTKLTEWAKDKTVTKTREVYVYYSATVNENAVIGPQASGNADNSGNPNEVRLEYKVGDGAEILTDWDKVTEFTFGIDVTKELQDSSITDTNKNDIQFIVYTEDNSTKTYYTFDGSNGNYSKPAADDKTNATKLSPGANGKIQIRGLDVGTYYVQEVKTVDGYNLLSAPVTFTITSDKGTNNFVDATNQNQYLGTLVNESSTSGVVAATVVNTKGFRLPSTGGPGIWMFVIGGAVVIAAGFVYYTKAGKQRS